MTIAGYVALFLSGTLFGAVAATIVIVMRGLFSEFDRIEAGERRAAQADEEIGR